MRALGILLHLVTIPVAALATGNIASRGTVVGADIHNVLNSNEVLTYNNTFVPDGPWLQPLAV